MLRLKALAPRKILRISDVCACQRVEEPAGGAGVAGFVVSPRMPRGLGAWLLDEDGELAARRYHLTAGQAGALARLARAQRVIPFHFSPRYAQSEHRLRQQVSQAFGEDRTAGIV